MKKLRLISLSIALSVFLLVPALTSCGSARKAASADILDTLKSEKYVKSVVASHDRRHAAVIKIIGNGAGSTGEVDVVDASTGASAKVPDLDNDDIRAVKWSFDDRYLAVDSGTSPEGSTAIVDAARLDRLLDTGDTGFVWSSDSERIAFAVEDESVPFIELSEPPCAPQIEVYELPSLRHKVLLSADPRYDYQPESLAKNTLDVKKTDMLDRKTIVVTVKVTM